MNAHLELRAAEGGADALAFAEELGQAYLKFADRRGWKLRRLSCEGRTLIFAAEGSTLIGFLQGEVGGHRVQRVPRSERSGRVHSSTVTVSLVSAGEPRAEEIREQDLEREWFSGSGAGGQHRNKHQNSLRLRHLPSGLMVTAQCRKRAESEAQALGELKARLARAAAESSGLAANEVRSQQIGSGMRADKRRTYRERDDAVIDHLTGRRARYRDLIAGDLDALFRA